MANCKLCGKKLGMFEEKYSVYGCSIPDAEPLCDKCALDTEDMSKAALSGDDERVQQLSEAFLSKHTGPIADLICANFLNKASEIVRESNEAPEERAARIAKQKMLRNFLITTGCSVEGFSISEYLGIASGATVLGTGFSSEISAAVNDFLGTSSNKLTEKIEEAKANAVEALKCNCVEKGANAAIGVTITISTLGDNMIVANADGTAVRISRV